MAKTPHSQCKGPGFDPWSGRERDPTCMSHLRVHVPQLRPSTTKHINIKKKKRKKSTINSKQSEERNNKITEEISETENRKAIKKINETKSSSLK